MKNQKLYNKLVKRMNDYYQHWRLKDTDADARAVIDIKMDELRDIMLMILDEEEES